MTTTSRPCLQVRHLMKKFSGVMPAVLGQPTTTSRSNSNQPEATPHSPHARGAPQRTATSSTPTDLLSTWGHAAPRRSKATCARRCRPSTERRRQNVDLLRHPITRLHHAITRRPRAAPFQSGTQSTSQVLPNIQRLMSLVRSLHCRNTVRTLLSRAPAQETQLCPEICDQKSFDSLHPPGFTCTA